MDGRPGGITHKFRNKKRVFPFRTQGGPRIVNHAGGSADVIGKRRNEIGSLSFEPGLVHGFIHPNLVGVVIRIAVFPELPVDPPACIVSVYDIDQTLLFAGMIAVVVHTDQIAVFIENKLVRIAETCSKHLKITSVRIGPYDHALVGILPLPAVGTRSVKSDIPDPPVDPAIGSFDQPGHAVSPEADVYSVTR